MGEIRKQSLSNVLISYSGLAIGFLNIMVLQPWMLSQEEIGLTRVLYAIAVLGGTIFPLGIGGSIIKFLPSFRERKHGHHGFLGAIIAITLPIFVMLALTFLLTESSWLQQYSDKSPLLLEYRNWLLPMIFVVGYANLFSIYLFADFQSVKVSWINDFFIRIYTTLITSLYFLHLTDQKGFFMLFAAGYFIQMLSLFYFAVKDNALETLRPDLSKWPPETRKKFASYTLAMTLVSISGMALKNIDVILIGGMLSLELVAVYSLALLVAGFIELPATSIGRIADSRISDAHERKEPEEIRTIYYSSVRVLTITGMFLFTGIVTCISDLLQYLPPKFESAAFPTLLIGMGALSNMSTGINSSILFYTSQVRTGTMLSTGLVILMILLNLWLIPALGVNGAALANGLSFFLFNFSKWAIIRNKFGWNPFGIWFLHSAMLCAGLTASLWLLPMGEIPAWLAIIIKGLIIIFSYYIFIDKTPYFSEVRGMKEKWMNKWIRKAS